MKCPIDDAELVMSERQGVEIDYCPTCRGVWLDRGELDKILDRAASLPGAPAAGPPAPLAAPTPPPAHRDDRYREDRYRDDRYRDERGRDVSRDQYGRPYRKKKESWLSDILDFG